MDSLCLHYATSHLASWNVANLKHLLDSSELIQIFAYCDTLPWMTLYSNILVPSVSILHIGSMASDVHDLEDKFIF